MGGWEFSGWEFIRVGIFRVAIFRVGVYQVGVFWVGIFLVPSEDDFIPGWNECEEKILLSIKSNEYKIIKSTEAYKNNKKRKTCFADFQRYGCFSLQERYANYISIIHIIINLITYFKTTFC